MQKKRIVKTINWFIIGLIFLPLLSAGLYFWSTNTISSLENYRSPLNPDMLIPGDKIGQPLTRRVVIVLFDALRYDTAMDTTIMPVFGGLRDIGASAKMSSQPPSYSAPGWVTLLTGAWPDINDSQPMNPPDVLSTRVISLDNIFAAADRADLSTAVSGYIWFENMLAASNVDEGFYTNAEDNLADVEVVTHALSFLENDYQLVLIHLDQIDFAGHHEGGPLDSKWKEAATRSDDLLAEIVRHLDFEKDTLLLFSDHGQIDKGGHGGNEKITLIEPFVAVGKCISPGLYTDILMVDIAPTIAVLLGANIPAGNQGTPLLEILSSPFLDKGRILEELGKQQKTLLSAYTQSIGNPITSIPGENNIQQTQVVMQQSRMGRLAKERIWRNLIAVFLVFLPGYLLFLRKERNILWLILGTLLFLVIFNFRYYFLDHNTYGFSWITGVTEFILYIGITSIIALIPSWLITMLAINGFSQGARKSAQSSLAVICVILYILLIPFLINFATNGIQTTWTLPDFTIHYLGFFFAVQALFVSLIGLFLIGVSAGIGKILAQNKLLKTIG